MIGAHSNPWIAEVLCMQEGYLLVKEGETKPWIEIRSAIEAHASPESEGLIWKDPSVGRGRTLEG